MRQRASADVLSQNSVMIEWVARLVAGITPRELPSQMSVWFSILHAPTVGYFVEAAGTTYRVGGGSIVPPPPISLHEPGRFVVFHENVSEVSERQQPRKERVSPRSHAPSISS